MMQIQTNYPLVDLSWWKIGGPADHFCQPESLDDLRQALAWAHENSKPITVLSGGSNALVSDQGVEGLVIHMSKLVGITERRENGRLLIEAWAGTPKADLVKVFLREKLAPAVFLCGIPGDVGGGVVMNAGVGEALTPREFVEIVDYVDVLRGKETENELIRIRGDQLRWSYRSCEGWQPGVVVRVGVSWPLEPRAEVLHQVRASTRNRLDKQPLQQPSCGSVFKNPLGAKAGALIERCGLKGFQRGQAQVSLKHANFIVNLGGARAEDVDHIIRHVRQVVFERTGFELHCEVKYLGRW